VPEVPTVPKPSPASADRAVSAVRRALRLGVCGPVGTGKTSLIGLICAELGCVLSMAVVTNDIYTDEDARMLRAAGVLAAERIRAVETGACPHTAIRDDISANLFAVEDLESDFDPVDLVVVESGGDNLTATFSPALVDVQVFVLDVAGGGRSGVDIRHIRMAALTLTGVFAGAAGVITATRLASGSSNSGTAFELEVITAVVLGGTSLMGGRGSVIGSAIGALTLGIISNGLVLLRVDVYWVPIVQGTILIVAIFLNSKLFTRIVGSTT